jgi:hypothetical protein
MIAAQRGDSSTLLRLMRQRPAAVTAALRMQNINAVMVAVRGSHRQTLRLLVQWCQRQQDILPLTYVGVDNSSALHMAVATQDQDSIHELLQFAAAEQLAVLGPEGLSPLMHAISKDYLAVARQLLEYDPKAEQLYGIDFAVLQRVLREQQQGQKYARPFCRGSCCWCGAVEGDAVTRTGVLPRCKGCCLVEYCSRKCQKKHWAAAKRPHKLLCERVQMLVA